MAVYRWFNVPAKSYYGGGRSPLAVDIVEANVKRVKRRQP